MSSPPDSQTPRSTAPPLPEDPALVQTLRQHGAGRLVFGRFRLVRELGAGGMAVVWLANDERLGLEVALKFLPGMVASDPEALHDLRREITRGLRLTHPGIVRVYDLHEDSAEGLAAIAMEYVDGCTLTDEKARQPDRCFDVAEPLLTWTRELCSVLTYVHEKAKVVHRDLKPRNLMLTAEGELKVADFGIAATLCDSHSRLTQHPGSSGTPVYMSPQQAIGHKPSAADDIYAVGATLYELLTSKPPFFRGSMAVILNQVSTQTPPSIADRRAEFEITGRPAIPPEWEETIAACLAKERDQRPASIREVARLLKLERVPQSANPSLAPTRADVREESLSTTDLLTVLQPPRSPVPAPRASLEVSPTEALPPGIGMPFKPTSKRLRWWPVIGLGFAMLVAVLLAPWNRRATPVGSRGSMTPASFSTNPPSSTNPPPSTIPTPPFGNSKIHQVKLGETLTKIAQLHNVTTAELAAANGLKEFAILRPGQSLNIPNLHLPDTGRSNSAPATTASKPKNDLNPPAPAGVSTPRASNSIEKARHMTEEFNAVANLVDRSIDPNPDERNYSTDPWSEFYRLERLLEELRELQAHDSSAELNEMLARAEDTFGRTRNRIKLVPQPAEKGSPTSKSNSRISATPPSQSSTPTKGGIPKAGGVTPKSFPPVPETEEEKKKRFFKAREEMRGDALRATPSSVTATG